MKTLLALALCAIAAAAQAQYPQRPVQLIVPWGAGGGTDATARIIGSLLEKELKQPFNVVNRTGGSGVVGHDAIANAAADGYTIGMITVEITMMHHVGLTNLKYTNYTPIGLVNADPAGIHVRSDSPYKSVKELLAAIKANPGKMKASGTGQGGIWHLAIAAAPADGYTIGLATVEIGMMHWQGLTDLNGASYTPIGLVNADPAGIQVRADAPYKTVQDLLAAIKANPGKFKASGTGQGGIWHLALAGLLRDQKIDPASVAWVPSNGAAPGLQDMVAGGVEVVPCSVPEARAMIDAGKVKALAIMDANPPALYPGVPTLKKELGSSWAIAAWRVIAAPKGIPPEAQKTLVTALKKVYDSKEYKEFMASRGFGIIWADPAGTEKFMAASDANLGAALKAVGLAK